MTLVVRNFRRECDGRAKKCSNFGRSRSDCRTMRETASASESETFEGLCGATGILGQGNFLSVGLNLVLVSPPAFSRLLRHLVYPAAMAGHGDRHSRGNHQLQILAA